MRTSDGFRPLSSVFDEWAAICISVAAVVYVLRTLPPLLAPSGLLGGLGCFTIGLALGLSASAALLVLLFIWVTEAERSKIAAKQGQAAAEPAAQWGAEQNLRGYKAIPTECPLPTLRRRGHFRDVIWTIPAPQWDVTEAIDEWPPTSEGPKAVASKWRAKLTPGLLVLKPDNGQHKSSASSVRLPLHECRIRVVSDGLRSKTRWWKKCPLELSHSTRPLLHGSTTVFIFAANGYAKEQLYLALQHSITDGAPFMAVNQLYAAFCQSTKALEVVPFPRAKDILEDMEAALQAAEENPQPNSGSKRRGWFRFGRGRHSQNSTGKASSNSLHVSASAATLAGRIPSHDSIGMVSSQGGVRGSLQPNSPMLFSASNLSRGTDGREESRHGCAMPPPAMLDPDELEKRWEGEYRSPDRLPATHSSTRHTESARVSVHAATTTDMDEALPTTSSLLNGPMEVAEATLRLSKRTTTTSATVTSLDSTLMDTKGSEGLDAGCESDQSDKSRRADPPLAASSMSVPWTPSLAIPTQPSPPIASHIHPSMSMPELSAIHLLGPGPPTPGSPCRTICSETTSATHLPARSDDGRSPHPPLEQTPPRATSGNPSVHTPLSPSSTPQPPHTPTPSAAGTPQPGAADGSAPHAAQKVAVEGMHGLNMMLTRLWFELLRSRSFEEVTRNLVQRKLDDIRRPPYLHRLQVTSVDMGTSGPFVRHIAALPCPNNSVMWPQVLMDVCYTGNFSLTIGTKVELSKSRTWRGLERTIESIRGQGGPGDPRPDSPLDRDMYEMTEALNDLRTDNLQEHAAGHQEQQLPGEQTKGGRRRWMGIGMLPGIRRAVADGIRNAVDAVSDSLAKIPFQIHVKLTRIEGTLLLWVPPPPSDRLWISFINTPKMDLTCKPSLGNRVLQSTTFLTRASSWLHGKLLRALTKSCVFPACSDIKLPWFADLEAQTDARPMHLPNFNQYAAHQQQQWETASSSDSDAADDDHNAWLADDVSAVVSHPVTDLLESERTVRPKQLRASLSGMGIEQPPPVERSPESIQSMQSMTSRSDSRSVRSGANFAAGDVEARKQRKKEHKEAKEAKRREAKEQRAEAKKRDKQNKLLAREISATSSSLPSARSSQSLNTMGPGSRTAMLKRPWFKRSSIANANSASPGVCVDTVGQGAATVDTEPQVRTLSMGPTVPSHAQADSAATQMRRSSSLNDLAELQSRTRCAGRPDAAGSGYNSDSMFEVSHFIRAPASEGSGPSRNISRRASRHSSRQSSDQLGALQGVSLTEDMLHTARISLPLPQASSRTLPPDSAHLTLTSRRSSNELHANISFQLPLPPGQPDLTSNSYLPPTRTPSNSALNSLESPSPFAFTPFAQPTIPFMTPPNSGDSPPLFAITPSHSATALDLLSPPAANTSAIACLTPATDHPLQTHFLSPPLSPSPPMLSPFATSEVQGTSAPNHHSEVQHPGNIPTGRPSTPVTSTQHEKQPPNSHPTNITPTTSALTISSFTKISAKDSIGSASSYSAYQTASTSVSGAQLPEASMQGIRRNEHSQSTPSLVGMGSGGLTDGLHASMGLTVAGGTQVVHRLKNIFGDRLPRSRGDAGSEASSHSRRSHEAEPSSAQVSSSPGLLPHPSSGGARLMSSALSKMSSAASVAKAEGVGVGKRLAQSALARLRDAALSDSSTRNLTYNSEPSSSR